MLRGWKRRGQRVLSKTERDTGLGRDGNDAGCLAGRRRDRAAYQRTERAMDDRRIVWRGGIFSIVVRRRGKAEGASIAKRLMRGDPEDGTEQIEEDDEKA